MTSAWTRTCVTSFVRRVQDSPSVRIMPRFLAVNEGNVWCTVVQAEMSARHSMM